MYKKIVKHCLYCGVLLVLKNNRDIERKNFCCKSHANTYTSSHRVYDLPEVICPICNGLFKPRVPHQRYCSIECTSTKQIETSYKYLDGNKEGYIKHLICKPERKHLPLTYFLELYNSQKGKCALSGIDMTFIKKTDGVKIHTNLSIDRIDSSKGYEIGNIQLVCAVVNIMKTVLSTDELIWWCTKIVKDNQNAT